MLEEILASDQAGYPILSLLTFLPIVTALLVWRLSDEALIRRIGLWAGFLFFLLSLHLYFGFVPGSAAVQFAENIPWIKPLGIQYHLGVDGISVFFVILTAMLTFLILLYSVDGVGHKLRNYVVCLLSLEGIVIGIFSSLDLVLFFFFWEIMLIPSYFLIKVWGAERKEYAALKFMIYNLAGSVLMLIGIAILFLNYHDYAFGQAWRVTYSTDLIQLLTVPIGVDKQIAVFILFFFAFAVKTPMVPFHTWLPDVLYSGPVAASVVLAGIKLGTYGFLRFSLPLAPEAAFMFVPWMMAFGLIAILYGGVIALMQSDLKRMMAYSSVGHLGFVVVGLFALNFRGLQGSLIQMLNLGITTAGLFFIIGFLMNRRLPTQVSRLGGLAKPFPVLASVALILALSSIGLPGTSGFVGEFLILLGAFEVHWFYAAVAVLGIIIGAAYMLWMYEQAIFGKTDEEKVKGLKDFNLREWAVSAVLVVLVFWIGIYPAPFLKVVNPSVDALVERLERGASSYLVVQPGGQGADPRSVAIRLGDPAGQTASIEGSEPRVDPPAEEKQERLGL